MLEISLVGITRYDNYSDVAWKQSFVISNIRSVEIGTVENHGKKMAKNTANFCENPKNHGKITAKTRHQITGPKTVIQSIKLKIWH